MNVVSQENRILASIYNIVLNQKVSEQYENAKSAIERTKIENRICKFGFQSIKRFQLRKMPATKTIQILLANSQR